MKNQQAIINKVLQAPIEKVFNAFVDPSLMVQWYSPGDMTTPHAEVDLRIGGSYAVTMSFIDKVPFKGMAKDVTVRGIYKEIDRPNKLVFTWKWDGQEDETLVTVEFDSISENQTAITLVHSGFVKDEAEYPEGLSHKNHKQGWTTALVKLESVIGSGDRY